MVCKGDRASLEGTVQQVSLPLESVLVDPLPKDVLPLSEARKMDLEMAVIMQVVHPLEVIHHPSFESMSIEMPSFVSSKELMAMREERARLRTQVYILEKERAIHEAQHQSSTARTQPNSTVRALIDFLLDLNLIRWETDGVVLKAGG